ncbi:hypothetical protein SAY86_001274 [Trapa natans]|uniref:CRIB domain-containing protein n=1 Tax=Trapa natans TaxID=22666 RepID=A0AAN7RM91_TRANT|nr:hypothetical protein SAY86_001274 [Trapa natans]
MSESSVRLAPPPARRSPAPLPRSPPIRNGGTEKEGWDNGTWPNEGTKGSMRSLSFRKTNISTGIHRMFKGFKNISHMFAYKEESEEEETAIQIGLPTDVKHITHIGWDGLSANYDHDQMKSCRWDGLFADPHLLPNKELPPDHHLPPPGPIAEKFESWPSRRRQDPQPSNPGVPAGP